MMMLLLVLLLSLTAIWIASGIMVSHTKHLSSYWRFPSFSFSLLLLGTLTSIPEFLVAFNSILLKQPEISLGNLIGGQVILMLCIIPLLALKSRGLRIHYPLQPKTLALTLFTISLPFLASLNQYISLFEATIMAATFTLFVLVFATDLREEHKQLALRKKQKRRAAVSIKVLHSLGAIAGSIAIIFFATNRLVTSVSTLALLLHMDSFFVSLFVTAIGTNVPEITLAVRALFSKTTDIALGDYIGSAAVNTIVFSVITFAHAGIFIVAPTIPLLVPLFGFLLLWWFARSKHTLSFAEAVGLLSVFFLFLVLSVQVEIH